MELMVSPEAPTMVKGLECLFYEERQRRLGEGKAQGHDLINIYKYLKGG